MQNEIRIPKSKKPVKSRKPSRPLDGINHRLLAEQAAKATISATELDDNSEPTREELEAKAQELGIKFDGRTSDKKLNSLIEAKLK
jgi:hypothetical protein